MTQLIGCQVLLPLFVSFLALSSAHAATDIRTSAFEYDPDTGLLTKEIIEPNLTQMRLETSYAYDAFGNKLSATVSSPATGIAAIAPRSSSSAFDARGQFATSSTNALGQSETRTFDPKFGNVFSLTGPNGLTTAWQYDVFGRKILETRADGTKTKWEYLYCIGPADGTITCPDPARYMVQVTPLAANGVTPIGPWSKTYFDALGREIRYETQRFDGITSGVIIKETQYDSLGRVYRVSDPYYKGQTVQWTTMTYDIVGRVIATTLPDMTQSTVTYSGLTTTTTNALNQTQSAQKNSQGQIIKVTDAANNSVTYKYDPFGNLTKTTDSLGNITTLVYDQRGRKIQMIDPDMGAWNYEYDVLGQLKRQTDAKNQVTTLAYDLMGRMTSRAEVDMVSTWTFDTCAMGVGKLCIATSDNGYTRSHSYDNLGRANSTTTVMDTAYTAGVTFDANGRVATQTYPTGFAVKYVYNPLGYLKEVRSSANNALFWNAGEQNAKGQLLQQTYGNGVMTQHVFDASSGRLMNIYAGAGNSVQHLSYAYDSIGNMLSRSDDTQGLNESFLYDSLNRLTNATVNSGPAGVVMQSFAYNAIGNITSRTDVGTYTYGVVNNRPHAVLEVAMVGGGKRTYTYDANGAVVDEVQYDATNSVIPNKGRHETYTSFGMPNAMSASDMSVAFAYGPEHQRVKQIAMKATTIYLHPDNAGGLFYEKELKTDGAVEHKHFITAGGQVIAQVKRIGTTDTVQYFHRDHLGSSTAITDASGAVMERLAYEAFGKRRFPEGMTDPNNIIEGATTDRGYTNHEHLEELGLIHMNGRIFDPQIGRFMSADPYVESPFSTQSYNRYSYVGNNPLTYTDPSGFFSLNPFKHHKSIHKALAGGAKDLFNNSGNMLKATLVPTPQNMFHAMQGMPGQASVDRYIMSHEWAYAVGKIAVTVGATAACWGAWECGAAAGAFWDSYYTYYATSSTSASLRAGAITFGTAAAFNAVGSAYSGADAPVANIVGHALIGCASAAASGGNCGNGALAAGVSSAYGNYFGYSNDLTIGTMQSAMVGGISAVAGGGKFSEGFTTGAFGYIFNHWTHYLELARDGQDAHKALQGRMYNAGLDVERNCAGNFCLDGKDRFDVADRLTGELWEIKRNSITGRATGSIAVRDYTNGTGFRPGGDLPGLPTGGDLTVQGTRGWYTYQNLGGGLVVYNKSSTSTPPKVPLLGPVPGLNRAPSTK